MTASKVALATGCGLLAAPLFVSPLPQQRTPVPRVAPSTEAQGTFEGSSVGPSAGSAALGLGLGATAILAAAGSRRQRASRPARAAFDPTKELGVQAPIRFWDPLGFCLDGDEAAFRRRRGVEIKHGRIAMIACIGYIVPEYYRFPGYLSESENITFKDVPNGIAAISKVPALGWAQIVLFAGLIEGRFASMERAPGDYNQGNLGLLGLLGPVTDPELRAKKLNAEIANGRLAMFAIIGLLFQNGVTGTTGEEMYGAGENTTEVYKIFITCLLVFAIAGQGFRGGPGKVWLESDIYPRNDYYGKDRI